MANFRIPSLHLRTKTVRELREPFIVIKRRFGWNPDVVSDQRLKELNNVAASADSYGHTTCNSALSIAVHRIGQCDWNAIKIYFQKFEGASSSGHDAAFKRELAMANFIETENGGLLPNSPTSKDVRCWRFETCGGVIYGFKGIFEGLSLVTTDVASKRSSLLV